MRRKLKYFSCVWILVFKNRGKNIKKGTCIPHLIIINKRFREIGHIYDLNIPYLYTLTVKINKVMSQPNLGFPSGKFLGTLGIIFLIDAGERGVLFRRFSGGLEKDKIYGPGFHVYAPWNTMYIYNVREQQLEEQMDVLSSNGLNIRVDVTVRAHPSFDKIPELHETFGKDFIQSLIRPEVRSSVRKIIGRFTPEELYSTRREEVQTLIQKDLEVTLSKNYVNLRAALIREISLPEKVRTAIEEDTSGTIIFKM